MSSAHSVAAYALDPHESCTTDASPAHYALLAIVLPTFNERDNVATLIARIHQALEGIAWEAIFVDDDSPDGTAEMVLELARQDSRIRLLHRIGRRGLSSACIEGVLATSAPFVAIMDADLQHDETVLPRMLEQLRSQSLDVVVGTRNSRGGSMGDFRHSRVLLSRLGQTISHAVCRCTLTDPMSGFFMLRRSFFLEVVRDLNGGGFKILVDLLSSSPRPVRLGEVGYTFGVRRHGESKLDVVVGLEYLFLVLNKLIGGAFAVPMMLYLLVGALGLVTHFAFLLLLTRAGHVPFVPAQIFSTFAAMAENFLLNNWITFRDLRLRGAAMAFGAARFVAACSFGAWANVIFARALWQSGAEWYLAGLAGIVLGSVWNLSVSSLFTWKMLRRAPARNPAEDACASDLEALR